MRICYTTAWLVRWCLLWTAVCALTSLPPCERAEAASELGPGAFLVGVGIGSGTRDALSIADIRPVTRGEALADLDIDLHLGELWAVGVGGQLGGSWFDFRQVFTPSGNIKDQDWALRGVLKRILVRGPPISAFVGVGIEYGEARSWTDTRFYSDKGPRTFFTGGTARLGFDCPVTSPVQLHAEIAQSLFRAHAVHSSAGSDYNWLGRSLSLTLGARIAILRGHVR